MGLLMGTVAWQTATGAGVAGLSSVDFWFWMLFALLLVPYVVNIGLGVTWGAGPRLVAVVSLVAPVSWVPGLCCR